MAVPYWADQLVADLQVEQVVINDSKTYSGSAHVGSLRGPVIHDVIYRAALDAGKSAQFLYGSDDYDALDAVPPSLSAELYQPYLGKPLCAIPAPDGSSRSYAEYFYDEFMAVQNALGIFPTPYRMSDLYRSGRMNGVIRTLLEHAETIRQIYLEVSNSEREADWYPFNPICENCGRIAMTRVYRFDGEQVYYRCDPDAMDYAKGCGYEGAVSPFDGNGKLPWKLEWAARWQVLGVNVEGAGMDHSIEGGSREVAEAVARRVFQAEPPANIPYEFLLLEGGKMSSSKGIGFAAREVAEALPAELLRYLLVRTRPRTAINFNLDKDAVPRLFDEFDTAAANYFQETNEPDEAWQKRIYELAQINYREPIQRLYRPRFTHLVTVAQIPGLNALKHFEEHKGAPLLPQEVTEIHKRMDYARIWLERFAPDSAIVVIRDTVPQEARNLTADQRAFLAAFLDWYRAQSAPSGEQIHKAIYDIATSGGLKPGQAFQVIYRAFLGRTSGPRAGELLAALEPDLVLKRLQQVENVQFLASAPYQIRERRADARYGDVLHIHADVMAQFPDLRIGVARIEGAVAGEKHDDLEALKAKTAEELARQYQGINLGSLERIKAYREIYRAFGVDPGKRSSSAEALLRAVTRGRALPTINTVVDAYNLTSAETMIPMAAYDAGLITFPVELRFAQAGDGIVPIGATETQPVEAGELVYADQQGVICWDFNYRDADRTKITPATRDVLLFVDGCSATTVAEVQDALDLAISRIIRYAGGRLAFAALIFQER
jgi:lysyl-tRNA synthetase class 1